MDRESKYHGYGAIYLDRGVIITCVGDRYTMGRGVDIPWIGGQNTMGRVSIYHG